MTQQPADSDLFPATDEAWQSRLRGLDPKRYAASRNYLHGGVSRLSPYFTHGFLSLSEAVDSIRQRTSLAPDDKLFAEFAWRSFFHHVWAHAGDAIFRDLRPALPNISYAKELPRDIREARTGLPVIDQAVAALYSSGYLHNHARMWLASYVIHLRHVHWRAGADWLYSHLLDGDLASNHLSWQWVASTFSTKPYLFNAENVARYAPAAWRCEGTPLDTSYEQLELMARGYCESNRKAFRELSERPEFQAFAIEEPQLYAAPPDSILQTLNCPMVTANAPGVETADAIELMHAWALRASSLVPSRQGKSVYRLGVIHLPYHARWPWSHRRWQFALSRMAALCDAIFIGNVSDLKAFLTAKEKLYVLDDLGARETLDALRELSPIVLEPPLLFQEPASMCQSFSKYFRSVTKTKTFDRRLHQA